jgi:hypothetical protein
MVRLILLQCNMIVGSVGWRSAKSRARGREVVPAPDFVAPNLRYACCGAWIAGFGTMSFDWHSDPISRKTPITASYRNTQNVRRFFRAQCGADFRFDRPFMAWLRDGAAKTMGNAVDEWKRRKRLTQP